MFCLLSEVFLIKIEGTRIYFAPKWMQLGEKIRIALRIPDLHVSKVVPIVVQKVKILDLDRTEAL